MDSNWVSQMAKLSVNRTARRLRLRVTSALRAPVARYLKRWVAYAVTIRPAFRIAYLYLIGYTVTREHL